MERRRWRAVVAAGTTLVLLPMLAACEAPPAATASDAWKETFALTSEQAATADEREALADGTITDQEYAYFQNQILECLDSIGVDASWTSDGDLVYNPNGAEESAINECNADHGIRLLALRDAIIRNPDHRDDSTIIVECLRRVGLVGQEYTADDLNAGVDIEALQRSADLPPCVADPLHHG